MASVTGNYMQLAVQHGCGGPHSMEKAVWFVTAVEQWFQENSDIEQYEVEDFLAEVLNNEFDTIADDGSLPHVSRLICKYFHLCKQGKDVEVISSLQEAPNSQLPVCVQMNGQDEEMDEDSRGTCLNEHNTLARLGGMDLCSEESKDDKPSTSTDDNSIRNDDTENSITGETVAQDDGWTVVKHSKKKK
ncbi:pre-rRNA-processing protein TSR2 homolog isoform X2 [Saccoglossus kowalevskii]